MFLGFLRIAASFALAGAVAVSAVAPPTSYSRQVAPILAMNCHACHGANPDSVAGGLSTRSWADLKKGGNLGSVILPGDAEGSPLHQFVSGARGEPHRMPLGGPPLANAEIETIRRWILEGATEDEDTTPKYALALPSVRLERSEELRISAKIPTTAYIELALMGGQQRTLYREGGAVKLAQDSATIGVAGEWITWKLRRASDWPGDVRAVVTIHYATREPEGAAVVAGNSDPEFPVNDGEFQVLSLDKGVVFRRSGTLELDRWKRELPPGWYVVHTRQSGRSQAAVLFRAGGSP
jgi:hypothetical protein